MITLINVFTVEPANQQRLVDLLVRVTDEFVRQSPGFVSSTLHRSFDLESDNVRAVEKREGL